MAVFLEIDGMTAVHAVRALHTALSGIDGITSASISMGTAQLGYTGPADDESLTTALVATLDLVGLSMISIRIEKDRQLPLV